MHFLSKIGGGSGLGTRPSDHYAITPGEQLAGRQWLWYRCDR